ncbi:MAG: PD40 domain-containing protein [Verrucomicrobia bacterium]|nr:PD40 domain-containing protein [Verrucomicrobiota bacterium]
MKTHCLNLLKLTAAGLLAVLAPEFSRAQNEIQIQSTINVPGLTRPIPVSLQGFSGEVAEALKFDLYVQGFAFVAPGAAQYQISGSDAGSVQGSVVDVVAHKTILSRRYTGADLRRQAHAFSDDIVFAITGKKGIAQTKIAFKVEHGGGGGEIYVADYDGYNAEAVTHDGAIVAAPAWVPGRLAVYYTSYKLGNPDIFFQDLSTGQRRVFAAFAGLNTSAAVSPDGSRVAMILSKSGSPDVWECSAGGSDWMDLTKTREDESSPCWSPDGRWICYATKIRERRLLAKVPAGGGPRQVIRTIGAANPSEPDWSPDGKWIAFTSQMGEFDICVVPASGGDATILVRGQDPSWSPNSRTLIFTRQTGSYRYVLSVLDVFTKQVKDVRQIPGNDSEPDWAK